MKWFLAAAMAGYSHAQNNLAFSYFKGRGVDQDSREAANWYLMAAEQGLASAQMAIGLVYLTGDGLKKDESEAKRWFRMAGEQGVPEALEIVEMIGGKWRGEKGVLPRRDRFYLEFCHGICHSRVRRCLRRAGGPTRCRA